MPLRLFSAVFAVSILYGQSLDQAKREFETGNYAKAAQLLESASKEPHACEALFYLGAARYRLKQIDPALIAFQSAVECDPKLVAARVALAEVYGEKRNFDEALKAYKAGLQIDPRNVAALRGAASIYIEREENYDALPLLEKLVAQQKGDATAHADLGAVYAATSNHDGAKAQFQEALRLAPNNASALTGLANLSFKDGNYAEGISLLKKAIEYAPKAFEPRYLLGSAYNRMGNYDEATQRTRGGSEFGAGTAGNLLSTGARIRRIGPGSRPPRRACDLRGTFPYAKENAEAKRTVAKLMQEAAGLIDSGDLHGARARMEEAHRLRPADDKTLFRLAGLEYDLQEYATARMYAQAAINIAPSERLYHYLFGLVNRSLGKLPEAHGSFETALRLNPSAAPVHNALGELALQENDPQRAIVSFEKAIELDPQPAAYRTNLDTARAAQAGKR